MGGTAAPGETFAIEGEIGSGAIATVVRVADQIRGGRYAAKILHDRHSRDEAANRRFLREGELSCQLQHPNLVRVYGTYEIQSRPALVMELVEGPNLADHLALTTTLPEAIVAAYAEGIAGGLGYAHGAGVIHRDLKPANVLLAPHGEAFVPKIADFGMARASSFASADKGAMTVLGTPHYMAPECLEPLAVDARTDLYALGCMIFEMLTGAPPYGGPTPFAVLEAHREGSIPPLPEAISRGMRDLVHKLLAKAPGDRPQSASAVVEALRRAPTSALSVVEAPGALMLPEARAKAAAEGKCASCGSEVLRELRVCFACGLAQVMIEPGGCSVFVTGPGRVSNKLDSDLRDLLVRWLDANATVGLDPTRIRQTIPRVPFPLVTGVSEASAETFIGSLRCLGLEAQRNRGGRISYGGMYRKANKLASRSAMVSMAVFGAPMMIHPGFAVVSLPAVVASLPVIYGATLIRSSRPMVLLRSVAASSLPPQVQSQLRALQKVVPQITERRHREALRTVVHRVVALCRDIGVDDPARPEIEAEMTHAIALAARACLRMDGLDAMMGEPGFDPAEPKHRNAMHERDMWSGRLLELTATLDALAARKASAQAQARDAAGTDGLDEVRAMVEALEEVQAG